MIPALESLIFSSRKWVLLLFAVATVFLGWQCSKLKIDAGFEKLLPLVHPYMITYLDYRDEFGGADRVLVALRAKDGDLFTPEGMLRASRVSDAVAAIPGVNSATMRSMFTPNVWYVEVDEHGWDGGKVVPSGCFLDFAEIKEAITEGTPLEDPAGVQAEIEDIRRNIIKSGWVGKLISEDFSTSLVMASLARPGPDQDIDYLHVARLLEETIRDEFQDEKFDVHIIGFAKSMGDVAEGAAGVLLFFGIALLITFFLVYWFTRSVRLTLLPLFCSLIAVVWNLGLLTLFGYGLDPMSLLVPFLVFAIGVSHGVQMMNAASAETGSDGDMLPVCRRAFRNLAAPGLVALLSDTVGFLTIMLIKIRIIQELAITASIGVLVIVLTNLILLPVLLSYVRLPASYAEKRDRREQAREPFWTALVRFTRRGPALTAIGTALLLIVWGGWQGQKLQIGDIKPGVPELRQESRYNKDTAVIVDKFSIGVDIINVIVETVPDGSIQYDVMDRIDEFQWRISNLPEVQSTYSLPQVARLLHAANNEANLKFRTLPRRQGLLVDATRRVESSTGLRNEDCSVIPVMIFTEDHKAETIDAVTRAVEEFASENNSDRHTFRLATGNVGVMAATNQVVRDKQIKMMAYIYIAIIVLCLLTFRSLRATLCIVLPLSVVSVLCYALMSLLGIGLKIYTLPVAALGAGIGVDYGIYIFSRLRQEWKEGRNLPDGFLQTLRVTGNAVLITGLCLAIGVSTWIWSDLQFQADMGVLLTFMFLGNMLGALVLIPALTRFFFPEKAK